jgi:hypothetical protein
MDQADILIASCAFDKSNWEPVASRLQSRGHNVTVVETDKIVTGQIPFAIDITNTTHQIAYDGLPLVMSDFAAAWYRRPTLFMFLEPEAVKQYTLLREVNALLQSVWGQISEDSWLNSPQHIAKGELKLTQLACARELGFTIPITTVTNKWRAISSSMPEEMIVKSSLGVLDAGMELKFLYTEQFNRDNLPTEHNPFPGIWQEFLGEKKREWRITIVGEKVFSAAIYTDPAAKDDWRKHQETDKVHFVNEAFPLNMQEKCKMYMRRLGLRFGAFDFVEDNAGNIVFLECNTNGQYGWLEEELGFPISEAIADELESIALLNLSNKP